MGSSKKLSNSSSAAQIRAELAKITKIDWSSDNLWNAFLERRTVLYYEVAKIVSPLEHDWTKGLGAERAQAEWTKLAIERLGTNDEYKWAVEGGWLNNKDLVSWFRASFWKNHKERVIKLAKDLANKPEGDQPPADGGEPSGAEPSGAESSGSMGWKDVMLS